MIPYPHINPDLISIGPVHVRWYGIMYVIGFFAAWFLIQKQRRAQEINFIGTAVQDFLFYVALGLVLGGRLGYILFYQYMNYGYYLRHPIEIIATWNGGMSFHGGMIGAVVAGWIFCRRHKLPFAAVADITVVTVPVGLGFGRIGNFINGELWGRVTDVPWGMVFPDGGPLPRHPSQLYEAFLEGPVLFALLWFLRKKALPDGMLVVFFLLFYGTFRFFLEFVREPDAQLGFVFGRFSMGQFLCAGMILGAMALSVFICRGRTKPGS